jgi:hypothetical protein
MTLVDRQLSPGVIFHPFRHSDRGALPDGVLELVPAPPESADRRDMAQFVYWHGLARLRKGEGEVRQIVMPTQPTFDDMLALEFVKRLLAGEPLPQGARLLAKYAKEARAGELHHAEIPVERSIKGIYLAVRHLDGDDLNDPAVAQRFCENWARMGKRVMQAAEEGLDPYTTPLFDDAEFALERAYLARDREVYRHDVRRGERWTVALPDAPGMSSALLLRSPKSLLFAEWSREDQQTPTGDPYRLLMVHWQEAPREWVFSTPRFLGPSLKPLHARLQSAETKKSSAAGERGSWDLRYNETMLASYDSGLTDQEIVKNARRWSRKRPLSTPEDRFKAAMAACGVLAAALLAALLAFSIGRPPQESLADHPQVVYQSTDQSTGGMEVRPGDADGDTTARTLEVVLGPSKNANLAFELSKRFATNWQARLHLSCISKETVPPADLRVQVGDQPPVDAPQGQFTLETPAIPVQAKDVARVSFRNASTNQATFTVRLSCRRVNVAPTLHFMAVGVSNYASEMYNLKVADADALAFASFCEGDRVPFERVKKRAVLLNQEATKDAILEALAAVKHDPDVQPQDVFVLLLAGHGEEHEGRYYFLPGDFRPDPTKRLLETQNAIPLESLAAAFPRTPKAIIMLDTCHSGTAASPELVQRLQGDEADRVVIAACRSHEEAIENASHGLFTLAFLEAVGVEPPVLPPRPPAKLAPPCDLDGDGIVTLWEALTYLQVRVEMLSDQRQAVAFNHTQDTDYLNIQIAKVPR